MEFNTVSCHTFGMCWHSCLWEFEMQYVGNNGYSSCFRRYAIRYVLHRLYLYHKAPALVLFMQQIDKISFKDKF